MNKIKTIFCISVLFLLSSCYEDKGNYQYDEIPAITFENMPKTLSLLQRVDNLVLDPIIKSSTEGIITQDNPDYEFGCRLYKQSGTFGSGSRWVDVNEEKTMKVDHVTNYDTGTYMAWYTVTNKRTGVVSNYSLDVKITGSTYEGWLVLCNVGAENRVRLDLVTVLSKEQKYPTYDVLGGKAPALRNGNKIMFDVWPRFPTADCIWLCTEDGTYELNTEILQTEPADNILNGYFFLDMKGQKVTYTETVPYTGRLAITNEGNLYHQSSTVGSPFESHINVLTEGHSPEFTVAPFIGVIPLRSLEMLAQDEQVALLYDKDNKRFIGWNGARKSENLCLVLNDPTVNKKFSYTTGQDIIAMVNTNFNNGTVYSILQADDRTRSVYGVNIAGPSFTQSYYKKMSIEGFSQANQFAFHSQYPYMFYSVDDKVYSYNYGTDLLLQPLTLAGEEITLMKFNPFLVEKDVTSDPSDEFMEQQHYLIVGSYKKNATDDNGGILRFYKFDQSTQTLTKVMEYSGFGKIKDVVYRERKK